MAIIYGVLTATFVAFVVSSSYYAVLAPVERRTLGGAALDRGRPQAWQIVSELVRTAVVASAFAWTAHESGLTSFPDVLELALVLWIGFPLVLLGGSITWERVPVVTAALHVGDWLLKLTIIAVAVGVLH